MSMGSAATGHTARRRTTQVLVIGIVALVGIVVAAPSMSAATNRKFCTALENYSSAISDVGSSNKAQLDATAASFRKAGKSAPSKVRSAMNTMADLYSDLAGASKTDAIVKLATAGSAYGKAVVKFTTYYVQQCSGLPTATVPTLKK